MSDITITLTEEEARAYITAAEGWTHPQTLSMRERIEAALPPEYPEGTVAWVTLSGGRRGDRRYLAEVRRDFGRPQWFGSWHGFTIELDSPNITKVEPLRVLKDDEIAVKMPEGYSTSAMRYGADALESTGNPRLAQWVRQVADAFEAEQK